MPLIKKASKKALEHNIEAEMEAGKPHKQALAIALEVRKHNKKKAHGGMIEPHKDKPHMDKHPLRKSIIIEDQMHGMDDEEATVKHMAKGGLVDAIKRKMAKGGEVDIVDNEEEKAAQEAFDQDNEDALYSESFEALDDLHQPEDSNLHGDDLDEEGHGRSMLDAIKRKLAKKRME